MTGYAADAVEEHLAARAWPAEIFTARTPDWQLPNGVSALAAAPLVGDAAALLVMCDHLVDPRLYDRLRKAARIRGCGSASIGGSAIPGWTRRTSRA